MKKWIALCILLIILADLSSCKTKKAKVLPINTQEVLPSTLQLENLSEISNPFNFNWFQAKCKATIVSGGNQHKLKLHLRIKKDSVIWISIKPSITVIEIARVKITQDSILFINYLNDEWYAGSVNELKQKFQFPLTLQLIQNIFLGRPYLINSFSEYNVLKIKSGVLISTSSIEDYKKNRLKGNSKKGAFQGLWFNDFKLLRNLDYDAKNKVELDLQYNNFTFLDGDSLAQNIVSTIISRNGKTSSFKIEYTKLQTDRPFSFPISIPDDYKRIKNLTLPKQKAE